MEEKQKKVLLVEDEEFIRDLYVRQLTQSGFDVKAVGDGNGALQALKSDTFDLLLLDIMLPGINGLQVLREFKAANANSPMKVVLLTNLGQEAVIKEGFELGAHAYLIKASFTPDQVVNEINNVLSGQPTTLSTSAGQ